MYGRGFSGSHSGRYHDHRRGVPSGSAPPRNPVQPTIVAQQGQQRSKPVRHQPHITGYNRRLEGRKVCRCTHPASHGDAFSHTSSLEQYVGYPVLGLDGQRMSWDEEMHRKLDALGKDYATEEELETTSDRVYHPDTLRADSARGRNNNWALARGLTIKGLPHDVVWHGRRNPLNVLIHPPPETPNLAVISNHGGYMPGPTAFAQGTRLPSLQTTLGLTWGASQFNRGGSSIYGRR
ncbi:hypothetical protein FB567DRAFT_176170 [Paraphoma chrysanthemicola]|uniref:Uncharacterized protein n=1 Tax=Paraphoma chrysanthemicola TaxID=798071 RepID=A0A8K0RHL4_9PLEO|nr:hypothetical protein FB567DRAFT_176170 [Paraphoma chrysanthemicola]